MDTGIQDPMVRALADKISSLAFQSQFEQFFLDHAPSFTDDKEHRLEYMTIYQQFQQIFNEHMEGEKEKEASCLPVRCLIKVYWRLSDRPKAYGAGVLRSLSARDGGRSEGRPVPGHRDRVHGL